MSWTRTQSSGASITAPRSMAPKQVNSRETRIGPTDPAGRHGATGGRSRPPLTRAAPGTYPRPESYYSSSCHGLPFSTCTAGRPAPHAGPGQGQPERHRQGPRLVHTHGSSQHTYGRAHTQTGAVPGTYPRPQSRAVRLILELYLETRLIRQVRAGRMAKHQKENLTRTKHQKHTRQVVRPNKQKWVTHPWPDIRNR